MEGSARRPAPRAGGPTPVRFAGLDAFCFRKGEIGRGGEEICRGERTRRPAGASGAGRGRRTRERRALGSREGALLRGGERGLATLRAVRGAGCPGGPHPETAACGRRAPRRPWPWASKPLRDAAELLAAASASLKFCPGRECGLAAGAEGECLLEHGQWMPWSPLQQPFPQRHAPLQDGAHHHDGHAGPDRLEKRRSLQPLTNL